MPNLRLALIAAAIWLGAGALMLGLAGVLEPGLQQAIVLAVLVVFALAGTLIIAAQSDRRTALDLAAVATAAGLNGTNDEALSMGEIVARLGRRLDRAHLFKTALSATELHLVVVDDSGQILAASNGITRLVRGAVEGASLDALFGDGYLDAGGGAPEQTLAVLAGRRFEVRRHPFAAKRFLLEFRPAGSHVQDDDLDAFVGALASGQTGFRFETRALAANPALAALNGGLVELDAGLRQLAEVAGGGGELPDLLDGPLGSVARRFDDCIRTLTGQLDEALRTRTRLEARLGQVGQLVEHFEARMTGLSAHAATNFTDAEEAGNALQAGSNRLQQARTIGRNAQNLTGAAELAAQRTRLVVGEIDMMTGEIDKMVQAIEAVSFRTNLLALNAAVDAARAGEKGAGFAVVADEVRQLAQLTNRSARDIREVVSRGRSQAETGVDASKELQKIIADLDAHLRNLSNETDTITATLSQGQAALSRLTGRLGSFEEPAEVANRPARRANA